MTLLNVKTAKIIAVIFVLVFGGIYHGALHVLYGEHHAKDCSKMESTKLVLQLLIFEEILIKELGYGNLGDV